MTTYTADEFKNARFATHPDGRIAARVVSNKHGVPWRRSALPSESSVVSHVESDAAMAKDGWSPLDESRLPRVVTDEMVRKARAANYTPAAKSGIYGYMRHIVAAALSVAPMTDEDARTYALEQIEAAQAETTEAVARAEKAERERDEAIREAEELGEALDNVKPVDTMTAREHLDAAWDAAYVPADGIIPAGAETIYRHTDGRIESHSGGLLPLQASESRRLLDEPTPVRPDGAEKIERLIETSPWHLAGSCSAEADWLAKHGVRIDAEDGEER